MVDVLKSRVLVAELFGTAVLMLGGPGAAVLAGEYLGVLGVSLSFGVTLMFLAYMIGPISGCHHFAPRGLSSLGDRGIGATLAR